MASFEEMNRTAVGILADTVEKAAPPAHPARRGIVRILRAFAKGDWSADLFEASRQFNTLDQHTRVGIARSSLKAAEEYAQGRTAEPTESGTRPAAKPGLLGVLNRS